MNLNYCAQYRHVRLRPLQESDIESLRQWRNDQTLSTFLRPIGTITPEMQMNWYKEYLTDKSIVTFAIDEVQDLNRLVGSVALYDFDSDTAEIGKIVVGDPAAKGKKIGYYALVLASYLGFQKCGLHTILGEVHEENMSAKTNDLRLGFQVVETKPCFLGGNELIMQLPKEHFEKIHPELSEIVLTEL